MSTRRNESVASAKLENGSSVAENEDITSTDETNPKESMIGDACLSQETEKIEESKNILKGRKLKSKTSRASVVGEKRARKKPSPETDESRRHMGRSTKSKHKTLLKRKRVSNARLKSYGIVS